MNNQYYDYYQPSNKHLAARPHYSPTPDSGYRIKGYKILILTYLKTTIWN